MGERLARESNRQKGAKLLPILKLVIIMVTSTLMHHYWRSLIPKAKSDYSKRGTNGEREPTFRFVSMLVQQRADIRQPLYSSTIDL